MRTVCVAVRLPNRRERRDFGASVVFERRSPGRGGERFTIYAAPCYESWQQWGAPKDVLWDNVPAVNAWRRGRLPVKPSQEAS